jgi:hypothetical protein
MSMGRIRRDTTRRLARRNLGQPFPAEGLAIAIGTVAPKPSESSDSGDVALRGRRRLPE